MATQLGLPKKKYSQHDLRKMMNGQISAKKASETKTKIESPLAKYNESGQLMCILCTAVVRSEAVWKVHVNAKQHKENVALAKQLKEATHNFTVPTTSAASKRPAPTPVTEVAPTKKLKSILKNSTQKSEPETTLDNEGLPSDFFDPPDSSTGDIAKDLTNLEKDEPDKMEVDDADLVVGDEKLPEGFFDDPVKDAKARNQEYKDQNDEEWERFQKAIKEETNVSMAIINEEQDEATAERQILEIDEQIKNWSRVLNLEKLKEATKRNIAERQSQNTESVIEAESSSEDESDDNIIQPNQFDEFLDWRAKKSHK